MHQTYRESVWDDTNFALFYQEYSPALLDYLRVLTTASKSAQSTSV